MSSDMSVNNVEADLAESWTISTDGLVYTFKLRQGVKWHDGQAFDADDVVYSINKMLDIKRSALTANFASIKTVEKVDAYTVKVTQSYVAPYLLVNFADGYAAIEAEHLAGGNSKTPDFLVGTGPFMFKSYVTGSSFSYVKNPNYFLKDSAGRATPYLDGMNYYVISDFTALMNVFISGNTDMTTPAMGISSEDQYQMVLKNFPNATIIFSTSHSGNIIVFNLKKDGPLKDVRVRQALTLLIESKTLCVAGYSSDRWMDYTKVFFEAPFSVTPAERDQLLGWDQTWDQRVAKAKQLLKDAGYADGFNGTLPYNGSNAVFSRILQTQTSVWKQNLNVNITIQPQELVVLNQTRDSGNWDLIYLSPVSSTGDPSQTVAWVQTAGSLNYNGYSNATVDKNIELQAKDPNMVTRVQECQEIERQILKDLPFMVLGMFPKSGTGLAPYVQGYYPGPAAYTAGMQMQYMWFDK